MFNDLEMEGGPWHLPANPPPYWKDRFQARSKIPGILVTYAKLAPEVSKLLLEMYRRSYKTPLGLLLTKFMLKGILVMSEYLQGNLGH